MALLYRGADGALRRKSVHAEYVSYHPRDEEMERALVKDGGVVAIAYEGNHLRVSWRDHFARRDMCRRMRDHGVAVMEGDVSPLRRLVSDHGLDIAKPRRLYMDIEVDSRQTFAQMRAGDARMLSWAAIDENDREFVEVLSEWDDAAEKNLLDKFWKLAEGYDQVIAWSGRHDTDTFDFIVLEQRSMRLGALPLSGTDRWLWLDHHDVFERMNKNSAESGAEKRSLKLQDVAVELLKHGKDDFDSSKTYEAWAAGAEGRDRLARYNLKDVRLMVEIEAKTGFIALFQTLCEACRVFPNSYALFPTVQMDGFLLRLGVERGYHFPTKWYRENETDQAFVADDQFEGAYVLHPTDTGKKGGRPIGMQHDVHVFDFSSMYPSIIVALNISLETKRGLLAENDAIPAGHALAPKTRVLFDQSFQGILPFAVAEMVRLRQFWKKKQAALPPNAPEWVDAGRRSNAYKVAANSFFGASGNKFCRFYDRQVAESISTTGAWLLGQTEAELPRWAAAGRMRPVYGDTDALYCVGADRAEFQRFVKYCNDEFYPKLLASIGATRGRVEIENEKGFRRIVWLSAKRYVGILDYYKGEVATATTKPEVKGLEWKRGDANAMTVGLQYEAVMLFADDARYLDQAAYREAVLRWKDKVLNQPLTLDQVKVSKSLGKDLKDYIVKPKKGGGTSAEPEHVRVARVLKDRGAEIGEGVRVEYFMKDHATRTVLPAEDFDGECDRHYLWEDKVYPPTQRVLEAIFPNEDWKALRRSRPPKERAARVKKAPAASVLALVVDNAPEMKKVVSRRTRRGITRSP